MDIARTRRFPSGHVTPKLHGSRTILIHEAASGIRQLRRNSGLCCSTSYQGCTLVTLEFPVAGKCLSYQAIERSMESIWCLVSDSP